jgi:uracil-DNA glycosylase
VERLEGGILKSMVELDVLLTEIRACQICSSFLPLGPRPILQVHREATILIAGQAPGRRVHASGIPFQDPSGVRLREWMGVSEEVFYDPHCVAVLPMGFCFPGSGRSGDKPPRPECAPAWREAVLEQLVGIRLTLVLGRYAQAYHLDGPSRSVTESVTPWREYWPEKLSLPHPSPRNKAWFKKNGWFEEEVLPMLRTRVKQLVL